MAKRSRAPVVAAVDRVSRRGSPVRAVAMSVAKPVDPRTLDVIE
ncbi:MAG: hypothetical protein V9G19_03440 [Tetrasphaera sp.]